MSRGSYRRKDKIEDSKPKTHNKIIKDEYRCQICKIIKPTIAFYPYAVLYCKYENFSCKECLKIYHQEYHKKTYNYEKYKAKLIKKLTETTE